MDPAEIQRLLNEGIAAVRRGDRAAGRELLLRLVAADEHSEPAWLWLSSAVDDPRDKLVALDNALTLNPANEKARAEADRLRAALGLAVPRPEPEPAPQAAPPPPAPAPPPDIDDDPLQCAFCGKLTSDIEDRCPHCGRSLLVPGRWENPGLHNVLLIILALATQVALLQIIGPVVAVGLNQGIEPATLTAVSRLPGVTPFFGDFLNWNLSEAIGLTTAVVVRCLLFGGTFVLFLDNAEWAFRAALVAPLCDLLLNGAGLALGYGGPLALGVNALLDVVIALLAWSAAQGQREARRRQRVVLDSDAHGPVDFNRRGLRYAREGRWALAAVHFQKAMVLDPHVPQYFKELARAQAELGRWGKALGTLQEGARRSPADAEFTALMAAVREKQ